MGQEQTPAEAVESANALIQSTTVRGSNKKKRVLFRAPTLTASGYGVHSRQIYRWLASKKNVEIFVEALKWGNTTWLIDPKDEKGLVGKIMERSLNDKKPMDMSIQVQLPNEWDPKLASFNVGVTAAVETDKCNPKWAEACNKMNMVIVPTEHTKSTLMGSGDIKTPVIVIPESYIDELTDGGGPLDLELDTSFNFLMVGQITGNNAENDRKNTYNTLKWLCETFKNDKDVGIILKANSGRNTHIDRRYTYRNVENCLQQVRKGDFPKVHLLHGLMTSKEMASLYRHPSIKAFVALTRGEGFGLPILEAAASGLPVITTDWSGHLDFMNKGRFIKVDYDLTKIPKSRQDSNIFIKDTKWAEPREKAAKKVLKKFRRSHEIPKKWALDLQTTLLEDYSHKAICSHYDSALLEFLKA